MEKITKMVPYQEPEVLVFRSETANVICISVTNATILDADLIDYGEI